MTRGVVVLLERLGIIDKRGKIVNGEKFSKVDRGLEIYGLTGYSCIEDRQVFGLSRGAQSCYPGHINIVYHDYDEYKERFKEGQAQKAKIEDLLKQIGPYDRLILNDFGDLIHLILRKIFWEKDVNITFEEKTSVSSNQKSFYQGFKIKNYQEGFTLKESLTIIATIESFFSNFYTLLKNFYQDFWLGKKDFKDLKNNYIQSLLNDLPNVSKTEAKHFVNIFSRLLDFLINIPPTYGQINYWLNNETLDDQTRAKLERKKNNMRI